MALALSINHEKYSYLFHFFVFHTPDCTKMGVFAGAYYNWEDNLQCFGGS